MSNLLTLNAGEAFNITPSDSTPLLMGAVSLYVGGAGNLNVITQNAYERGIKQGKTIAQMPLTLLTGIVAGTQLNIKVAVIMATLTTATLLVGLAP